MILTGVDSNHEDILDWWIKNAKKFVKKFPAKNRKKYFTGKI